MTLIRHWFSHNVESPSGFCGIFQKCRNKILLMHAYGSPLKYMLWESCMCRLMQKHCDSYMCVKAVLPQFLLQVPGLQIQKPEWMTINWWKLANLNYLARFSNESARSCYFRLNKGNNDQLKANLLQFWIAPVPLFILLLLSSQWLHIGSFCTNTNFISMILYFGHFSMKKLNFLPKKEKPTNSI